MWARAGTSGYQYKAWRGGLYTEGCKEADMLEEYARQLGSVEVNNTFYRMPKRSVLESWASRVPEDFQFTLKASRCITHQLRLKNAAEPLGFVLKNVAVLGERLGCLFFQLPPYQRKDLERLDAFLALLPDDVRCSFEFRHDSWFDEEVYGRLRDRNMALCLVDQDQSPLTFRSTADWGYLRLRRDQYSDEALQLMAARIGGMGWQRAYAYFKHEEVGAQLALRLQTNLEAVPTDPPSG